MTVNRTIEKIMSNNRYFCHKLWAIVLSLYILFVIMVAVTKTEEVMNIEDCTVIDEILQANDNSATNLISILQQIQGKYRYLSQEVMEYVAKKLQISPAKIYSVATFYENFSLEPKGKYVFRVCDGTACHVRKATAVINALRGELGLINQDTTDDLMFTIETVSCLGACGLAPVLTLNDVVYPAMTPDKVKALIKEIKEKENGKV